MPLTVSRMKSVDIIHWIRYTTGKPCRAGSQGPAGSSGGLGRQLHGVLQAAGDRHASHAALVRALRVNGRLQRARPRQRARFVGRILLAKQRRRPLLRGQRRHESGGCTRPLHDDGRMRMQHLIGTGSSLLTWLQSSSLHLSFLFPEPPEPLVERPAGMSTPWLPECRKCTKAGRPQSDHSLTHRAFEDHFSKRTLGHARQSGMWPRSATSSATSAL